MPQDNRVKVVAEVVADPASLAQTAKKVDAALTPNVKSVKNLADGYGAATREAQRLEAVTQRLTQNAGKKGRVAASDDAQALLKEIDILARAVKSLNGNSVTLDTRRVLQDLSDLERRLDNVNLLGKQATKQIKAAIAGMKLPELTVTISEVKVDQRAVQQAQIQAQREVNRKPVKITAEVALDARSAAEAERQATRLAQGGYRARKALKDREESDDVARDRRRRDRGTRMARELSGKGAPAAAANPAADFVDHGAPGSIPGASSLNGDTSERLDAQNLERQLQAQQARQVRVMNERIRAVAKHLAIIEGRGKYEQDTYLQLVNQMRSRVRRGKPMLPNQVLMEVSRQMSALSEDNDLEQQLRRAEREKTTYSTMLGSVEIAEDQRRRGQGRGINAASFARSLGVPLSYETPVIENGKRTGYTTTQISAQEIIETIRARKDAADSEFKKLRNRQIRENMDRSGLWTAYGKRLDASYDAPASQGNPWDTAAFREMEREREAGEREAQRLLDITQANEAQVQAGRQQRDRDAATAARRARNQDSRRSADDRTRAIRERAKKGETFLTAKDAPELSIFHESHARDRSVEILETRKAAGFQTVAAPRYTVLHKPEQMAHYQPKSILAQTSFLQDPVKVASSYVADEAYDPRTFLQSFGITTDYGHGKNKYDASFDFHEESPIGQLLRDNPDFARLRKPGAKTFDQKSRTYNVGTSTILEVLKAAGKDKPSDLLAMMQGSVTGDKFYQTPSNSVLAKMGGEAGLFGLDTLREGVQQLEDLRPFDFSRTGGIDGSLANNGQANSSKKLKAYMDRYRELGTLVQSGSMTPDQAVDTLIKSFASDQSFVTDYLDGYQRFDPHNRGKQYAPALVGDEAKLAFAQQLRRQIGDFIPVSGKVRAAEVGSIGLDSLYDGVVAGESAINRAQPMVMEGAFPELIEILKEAEDLKANKVEPAKAAAILEDRRAGWLRRLEQPVISNMDEGGELSIEALKAAENDPLNNNRVLNAQDGTRRMTTLQEVLSARSKYAVSALDLGNMFRVPKVKSAKSIGQKLTNEMLDELWTMPEFFVTPDEARAAQVRRLTREQLSEEEHQRYNEFDGYQNGNELDDLINADGFISAHSDDYDPSGAGAERGAGSYVPVGPEEATRRREAAQAKLDQIRAASRPRKTPVYRRLQDRPARDVFVGRGKFSPKPDVQLEPDPVAAAARGVAEKTTATVTADDLRDNSAEVQAGRTPKEESLTEVIEGGKIDADIDPEKVTKAYEELGQKTGVMADKIAASVKKTNAKMVTKVTGIDPAADEADALSKLEKELGTKGPGLSQLDPLKLALWGKNKALGASGEANRGTNVHVGLNQLARWQSERDDLQSVIDAQPASNAGLLARERQVELANKMRQLLPDDMNIGSDSISIEDIQNLSRLTDELESRLKAPGVSDEERKRLEGNLRHAREIGKRWMTGASKPENTVKTPWVTTGGKVVSPKGDDEMLNRLSRDGHVLNDRLYIHKNDWVNNNPYIDTGRFDQAFGEFQKTGNAAGMHTFLADQRRVAVNSADHRWAKRAQVVGQQADEIISRRDFFGAGTASKANSLAAFGAMQAQARRQDDLNSVRMLAGKAGLGAESLMFEQGGVSVLKRMQNITRMTVTELASLEPALIRSVRDYAEQMVRMPDQVSRIMAEAKDVIGAYKVREGGLNERTQATQEDLLNMSLSSGGPGSIEGWRSLLGDNATAGNVWAYDQLAGSVGVTPQALLQRDAGGTNLADLMTKISGLQLPALAGLSEDAAQELAGVADSVKSGTQSLSEAQDAARGILEQDRSGRGSGDDERNARMRAFRQDRDDLRFGRINQATGRREADANSRFYDQVREDFRSGTNVSGQNAGGVRASSDFDAQRLARQNTEERLLRRNTARQTIMAGVTNMGAFLGGSLLEQGLMQVGTMGQDVMEAQKILLRANQVQGVMTGARDGFSSERIGSAMDIVNQNASALGGTRAETAQLYATLGKGGEKSVKEIRQEFEALARVSKNTGANVATLTETITALDQAGIEDSGAFLAKYAGQYNLAPEQLTQAATLASSSSYFKLSSEEERQSIVAGLADSGSTTGLSDDLFVAAQQAEDLEARAKKLKELKVGDGMAAGLTNWYNKTLSLNAAQTQLGTLAQNIIKLLSPLVGMLVAVANAVLGVVNAILNLVNKSPLISAMIGTFAGLVAIIYGVSAAMAWYNGLQNTSIALTLRMAAANQAAGFANMRTALVSASSALVTFLGGLGSMTAAMSVSSITAFFTSLVAGFGAATVGAGTFGATLWTALAPILPILLLIAGVAAAIGGVGYLVKKGVDENRKSKESDKKRAEFKEITDLVADEDFMATTDLAGKVSSGELDGSDDGQVRRLAEIYAGQHDDTLKAFGKDGEKIREEMDKMATDGDKNMQAYIQRVRDVATEMVGLEHATKAAMQAGEDTKQFAMAELRMQTRQGLAGRLGLKSATSVTDADMERYANQRGLDTQRERLSGLLERKNWTMDDLKNKAPKAYATYMGSVQQYERDDISLTLQAEADRASRRKNQNDTKDNTVDRLSGEQAILTTQIDQLQSKERALAVARMLGQSTADTQGLEDQILSLVKQRADLEDKLLAARVQQTIELAKHKALWDDMQGGTDGAGLPEGFSLDRANAGLDSASDLNGGSGNLMAVLMAVKADAERMKENGNDQQRAAADLRLKQVNGLVGQAMVYDQNIKDYNDKVAEINRRMQLPKTSPEFLGPEAAAKLKEEVYDKLKASIDPIVAAFNAMAAKLSGGSGDFAGTGNAGVSFTDKVTPGKAEQGSVAEAQRLVAGGTVTRGDHDADHGVDIGARNGTPIVMPFDGTVSYKEYDPTGGQNDRSYYDAATRKWVDTGNNKGSYGYAVIVTDPKTGTSYLVGHTDREKTKALGLQNGQTVAAGTQVAAVGMSGNSATGNPSARWDMGPNHAHVAKRSGATSSSTATVAQGGDGQGNMTINPATGGIDLMVQREREAQLQALQNWKQQHAQDLQQNAATRLAMQNAQRVATAGVNAKTNTDFAAQVNQAEYTADWAANDLRYSQTMAGITSKYAGAKDPQVLADKAAAEQAALLERDKTRSGLNARRRGELDGTFVDDVEEQVKNLAQGVKRTLEVMQKQLTVVNKAIKDAETIKGADGLTLQQRDVRKYNALVAKRDDILGDIRGRKKAGREEEQSIERSVNSLYRRATGQATGTENSGMTLLERIRDAENFSEAQKAKLGLGADGQAVKGSKLDWAIQLGSADNAVKESANTADVRRARRMDETRDTPWTYDFAGAAKATTQARASLEQRLRQRFAPLLKSGEMNEDQLYKMLEPAIKAERTAGDDLKRRQELEQRTTQSLSDMSATLGSRYKGQFADSALKQLEDVKKDFAPDSEMVRQARVQYQQAQARDKAQLAYEQGGRQQELAGITGSQMEAYAILKKRSTDKEKALSWMNPEMLAREMQADKVSLAQMDKQFAEARLNLAKFDQSLGLAYKGQFTGQAEDNLKGVKETFGSESPEAERAREQLRVAWKRDAADLARTQGARREAALGIRDQGAAYDEAVKNASAYIKSLEDIGLNSEVLAAITSDVRLELEQMTKAFEESAQAARRQADEVARSGAQLKAVNDLKFSLYNPSFGAVQRLRTEEQSAVTNNNAAFTIDMADRKKALDQDGGLYQYFQQFRGKLASPEVWDKLFKQDDATGQWRFTGTADQRAQLRDGIFEKGIRSGAQAEVNEKNRQAGLNTSQQLAESLRDLTDPYRQRGYLSGLVDPNSPDSPELRISRLSAAIGEIAGALEQGDTSQIADIDLLRQNTGTTQGLLAKLGSAQGLQALNGIIAAKRELELAQTEQITAQNDDQKIVAGSRVRAANESIQSAVQVLKGLGLSDAELLELNNGVLQGNREFVATLMERVQRLNGLLDAIVEQQITDIEQAFERAKKTGDVVQAAGAYRAAMRSMIEGQILTEANRPRELAGQNLLGLSKAATLDEALNMKGDENVTAAQQAYRSTKAYALGDLLKMKPEDFTAFSKDPETGQKLLSLIDSLGQLDETVRSVLSEKFFGEQFGLAEQRRSQNRQLAEPLLGGAGESQRAQLRELDTWVQSLKAMQQTPLGRENYQALQSEIDRASSEMRDVTFEMQNLWRGFWRDIASDMVGALKDGFVQTFTTSLKSLFGIESDEDRNRRDQLAGMDADAATQGNLLSNAKQRQAYAEEQLKRGDLTAEQRAAWAEALTRALSDVAKYSDSKIASEDKAAFEKTQQDSLGDKLADIWASAVDTMTSTFLDKIGGQIFDQLINANMNNLMEQAGLTTTPPPVTLDSTAFQAAIANMQTNQATLQMQADAANAAFTGSVNLFTTGVTAFTTAATNMATTSAVGVIGDAIGSAVGSAVGSAAPGFSVANAVNPTVSLGTDGGSASGGFGVRYGGLSVPVEPKAPTLGAQSTGAGAAGAAAKAPTALQSGLAAGVGMVGNAIQLPSTGNYMADYGVGILKNAAVGGIASVITGGSFAAGAMAMLNPATIAIGAGLLLINKQIGFMKANKDWERGHQYQTNFQKLDDFGLKAGQYLDGTKWMNKGVTVNLQQPLSTPSGQREVGRQINLQSRIQSIANGITG